MSSADTGFAVTRGKRMGSMVKDKVVVVTGAGGGIGRHFALQLAAQGDCVAVNDIGASVHGEGRDAGPAQKVADEIAAAGGRAVPDTHSVADRDSANGSVKIAIDAFGRIDGVVPAGQDGATSCCPTVVRVQCSWRFRRSAYLCRQDFSPHPPATGQWCRTSVSRTAPALRGAS